MHGYTDYLQGTLTLTQYIQRVAYRVAPTTWLHSIRPIFGFYFCVYEPTACVFIMWYFALLNAFVLRFITRFLRFCIASIDGYIIPTDSKWHTIEVADACGNRCIEAAMHRREPQPVVKLLKSRWWNSTFPPFPFSPLPFPFLPLRSLSLRSLSLPSPLLPSLRVGPLNPAKGLGERCTLSRAPAEIEFGAFKP